MRKNPVLQLALVSVLAGMTTVAVGCSTNKPNVPSPGGVKETETIQAAITPLPTATPPVQATPQPQAITPSQPANGGIETASGNGTGTSDEGANAAKNVAASSDKAAPDVKPTPPPTEYTVKKPALLGISLTDSLTSVLLKLGKPENEYTMDDETDPITAYEYRGFVIGFNKAKIVQFIEITSPDVNPGLKGFRLGQNIKAAVEVLGKPDISNKYAMSYKSAGTILKFDVDPSTQNVLSIKLFADIQS